MAKRKIVKLLNGASSLMLLNGKETSHMATKKRSKKAPARRHSGPARKAQNPSRTRSRRRFHRNPGVSGLVTDAITAGIGAMATDYVASFLPFSLGPLARIGAKAGIAVGLGKLVSYLSPSHKSSANLITLGGAANAATDLVRWGFPSIQRIFLPGGSSVAVAPGAQPAGDGMADIVTLDAGDYDSYYGQMPAFPGMADIATVPNDGYFN